MPLLFVIRPFLGRNLLLNVDAFIEGSHGLSLGFKKLPGSGDELGFSIQAQVAGLVALFENQGAPFACRPNVALS